jgi:hypothetical protein
MCKLTKQAEMAMWDLADKIREDFGIAVYAATVQSDHLPQHPSHVCGPIKDGEPAIYLGIFANKSDPRVGKLPLTYMVENKPLAVRYYFVKSAPSPQ